MFIDEETENIKINNIDSQKKESGWGSREYEIWWNLFFGCMD